MTDQYDLIIIGSGAGGGTLAHRLAPTGKRILLLERGDYLPRERENWDPTAVFVQSKYKAKETWYGSDGRPFHPGMEGASVAAVPGLLRFVFRLNENRGRVPILPLPRQIIPTLQQQDALARRGEPVSQRAPSRAAADDDEIVLVRHAPAEC